MAPRNSDRCLRELRKQAVRLVAEIPERSSGNRCARWRNSARPMHGRRRAGERAATRSTSVPVGSGREATAEVLPATPLEHRRPVDVDPHCVSTDRGSPMPSTDPVVEERPQQMEAEAVLERRRRELLLRVRGHQRGVHVDHQRRGRVDAVVGGVLAGQRPRRSTGGHPSGMNGSQRRTGLAGEGVEQPGHPRIRGHWTEYLRMRPQLSHIGQAVPADGQRDGQIQHDLARAVPGQRPPPRRERRAQRDIQRLQGDGGVAQPAEPVVPGCARRQAARAGTSSRRRRCRRWRRR
jgi:hypothetical protein